MKKYRIISLILVFALSFSMVTFAEDKSEQEIATIMNQIGLLSGDGSGFNLSGELTRAEAATFIVKLIGKEKVVLASPSFYGMTPFTDVKGDEWFAPFVGFCSMNGIISGYPDNTFRADQPLTEKAFLTMMLKALEYNETDFTWDNVFLKAYEKGIVDDAYYAFKVEDNSITRGKVLALEYNALNLRYKNSSKTMIENLITSGVVTQAKAASYNLVKNDTTQTSITKTEATSESTIVVTLNENIKSLTKEQVKVDIGSTGQTISNVLTANNVVTITLGSKAAVSDMIVTLINVEDNENNVASSLSSNVTAYDAPEVSSDYFKVKSVEGVSKNLVHVFFTQPVNINVGLVAHYQILENGTPVVDGNYNEMEVAVLGEVDNGVAIWSKGYEFKQGVVYTLKARGSLTSAYDANLDSGNDMTFDFVGDGRNNTTLSVDSADAISNDTVRIVFNQDIDKSIATNIANYRFKNATTNSNSAVLSAVMSQTGPEKDRTVDLKVLTMTTNASYELTILNARNAFKASTISNNTYTVVPQSVSVTGHAKLEYVQPVTSTKLYLYFDKPIHSASIAANIIGVDDVLIQYSSKYNNRLVVYLDKDKPIKQGSNYTLQVSSGLIEADGRAQSYPLSFNFQGVDIVNTDIGIEDARFVADSKVKITFNSEISVSNGASQFKLQYKNDAGHDVSITADSINYLDELSAVVSFSNLPNETYKLVALNIVDPSNQYTTQEVSIDVTKE